MMAEEFIEVDAHWNHRVLQFRYPDDGTREFCVCEVFYGDAGKPDFFSDPQPVRAHSLQALIAELGRWQVACAKPVLEPIADFGDTYDGPRHAATKGLRHAAEQFVAWFGDGCGNVSTMLDYFNDIFSEALKEGKREP